MPDLSAAEGNSNILQDTLYLYARDVDLTPDTPAREAYITFAVAGKIGELLVGASLSEGYTIESAVDSVGEAYSTLATKRYGLFESDDTPVDLAVEGAQIDKQHQTYEAAKQAFADALERDYPELTTEQKRLLAPSYFLGTHGNKLKGQQEPAQTIAAFNLFLDLVGNGLVMHRETIILAASFFNLAAGALLGIEDAVHDPFQQDRMNDEAAIRAHAIVANYN